jgi:hypothetical protein
VSVSIDDDGGEGYDGPKVVRHKCPSHLEEEEAEKKEIVPPPPPHAEKRKLGRYTFREKLEAAEYAHKHSIKAASLQFEVDPKSIREWMGRTLEFKEAMLHLAFFV